MTYTEAQIDKFSEISWEIYKINNTTDIFFDNQDVIDKIQDLLLSAVHKEIGVAINAGDFELDADEEEN